jgi:hypothetical protein
LAAGISARLTPRELQRFGVTVSIPLALLAAWGAWRGHTILPALLGGFALVLGGLALLAPHRLSLVHRGWMKGADILGAINTRLLMGLVYFLVMTPTGVLMRLLGRDPLDRRLHDRPSYWVARTPHPDPKGAMERRF